MIIIGSQISILPEFPWLFSSIFIPNIQEKKNPLIDAQ